MAWRDQEINENEGRERAVISSKHLSSSVDLAADKPKKEQAAGPLLMKEMKTCRPGIPIIN